MTTVPAQGIVLTGDGSALSAQVANLARSRGLSVKWLGPSLSPHFGGYESARFPSQVAIEKTLRGASCLIHLSEAPSLPESQENFSYDLHVRFTRNLLVGCLKEGVPKAVVLSTAFVLNREGSALHPPEHASQEVHLRWLAEQEARAAQAKGLDLSLLRPAHVAGSGAQDPLMVWLLRGLSKGRMAGAPPGFLPLTDLDDLAEACLSAMTTSGEFNLAGHCPSMAQFFRLFAKSAGVSIPGLFLSDKGLQVMIDPLKVIQKLGLFTNLPGPDSIKRLTQPSASKANSGWELLGLSPKALEQTVAESALWIDSHEN